MLQVFDEYLAASLSGIGNEVKSVLLAVSGGADSLCMAELFVRSKYVGKLRLGVAHCNFHLRAEQSDKDEELVRRWCQKHKIEYHRADFNTQDYALSNGISIEMAARDLRYSYFRQLCKAVPYDCLAVAHNANDNAETLVLNLLRGTGLKGLTAIKALFYFAELPIIRPLLSFTREQIVTYMKLIDCKYNEDLSNYQNIYKRNKVRNQIFPLFKEINPSFVTSLNKDIEYFRQSELLLEDYLEEKRLSLFKKIEEKITKDCFEIKLNQLLQLKHWEYLLHGLFYPYNFNSSTIKDLENSLSKYEKDNSLTSGKLFYSSDKKYILVLSFDKLLLLDAELLNDFIAKEAVEAPFLKVEKEGLYRLGTRSLYVKKIAMAPGEKSPFTFVRQRFSDFMASTQGLLKGQGGKGFEKFSVFDASVLDFPFVIRPWQKGDWMCPLGLKAKKKLSDIFVDMKYSILDKAQALVLSDVAPEAIAAKKTTQESSKRSTKAGATSAPESIKISCSTRVLALLGERIDDKVKLSGTTSECILIALF